MTWSASTGIWPSMCWPTRSLWQDLAGGGGLDWAYWAFVPWGIGLLSHAMAVFVLTPAWQERKVQELLEKDRSVH